MLSPYKHNFGQTITTDVEGVSVDRAFLAHFHVPAASAVAASDVGVHAAIPLTAEVQAIVAAITDPAVPRNISIKGNAAGVVGDVVITGTNYAGEEITETIALNGATAVVGAKAFKTVTKIDLPVEVHAGTDTVSVGWGDIFGLPYMLPYDTTVKTLFNKAADSMTIVTDDNEIEKNTFDMTGIPDGLKDIDIYLIV
jgi:hypothetical protein